jgi:uncharacterized membrane protein YeaQ/YmgE (transglycosylase-associated protein family)
MWLEFLHQIHEGWRQYVHNVVANTVVGIAGSVVAVLSPAHEAVDVWLDTSAKTIGVLVAVLSAINLSLTIYQKLQRKRD